MFKMVLMLEAMGINLLMRYKATPTTINTMTRFSKGIFELLLESVTAICCPIPSAQMGDGLHSRRVFGNGSGGER
jgi:hypothetical protein